MAEGPSISMQEYVDGWRGIVLGERRPLSPAPRRAAGARPTPFRCDP